MTEKTFLDFFQENFGEKDSEWTTHGYVDSAEDTGKEMGLKINQLIRGTQSIQTRHGFWFILVMHSTHISLPPEYGGDRSGNSIAVKLTSERLGRNCFGSETSGNTMLEAKWVSEGQIDSYVLDSLRLSMHKLLLDLEEKSDFVFQVFNSIRGIK